MVDNSKAVSQQGRQSSQRSWTCWRGPYYGRRGHTCLTSFHLDLGGYLSKPSSYRGPLRLAKACWNHAWCCLFWSSVRGGACLVSADGPEPNGSPPKGSSVPPKTVAAASSPPSAEEAPPLPPVVEMATAPSKSSGPLQ